MLAGLALGACVLLSALNPMTPTSNTPGIVGTVNLSTLVPTAPMLLSDNASVAAVADSGSGTAADPYIIENRSFQLNYTDSGIICLALTCSIIIRNCLFNATDPSGVAFADLAHASGRVWIDNCTAIESGLSGVGFLDAPNGKVTNCVLKNNSDLLLDTVDNFYAENITLEDSMIACIDIDILTHSISNNMTFKNINVYETGIELTTGLDIIMMDVDGVTFDNMTLDCETETCSAFIINATDVTFNNFTREAPELGFGLFNVTGLNFVDCMFDIDDNMSVSLLHCHDINMTDSEFTSTSTTIENIGMFNCTNVIVDNCTVSGGNASISISLSSGIEIQESTFLSNNTALALSQLNDTSVTGNTFSFNAHAFYVGNALNMNMTGNIFENITTGDVFSSDSVLTSVNVSNNAYWDYFDVNQEYAQAYFEEGDILPEEYTTFTTINDTSPFYSEYLFGARVNVAPVADFTWNASAIYENEYVEFNFTGNPGNVPSTFVWDFGDMSNWSGENVSHQYTTAGTYTVTLNVTDYDGQSSEVIKVSIIIVSVDYLPFSDFYIEGEPSTVYAGDSYMFIFSGIEGDDPNTYQWNFGDGSKNRTTQDARHVFDNDGTYVVTLTVTDKDGQKSTYRMTLKVKDKTEPDVDFPIVPRMAPLNIVGIVLLAAVIPIAFVVFLVSKKRKGSMKLFRMK